LVYRGAPGERRDSEIGLKDIFRNAAIRGKSWFSELKTRADGRKLFGESRRGWEVRDINNLRHRFRYILVKRLNYNR
jgi:hypothetical protein